MSRKSLATSLVLSLTSMAALSFQSHAQAPAAKPAPLLDRAAMDPAVDPCNDLYQYACGKFAANHPIPADQTGVDQFYLLFNVTTEKVNKLLTKYAVASPGRTPAEQKIGDSYAACLNTDLIEKKDLIPIQPLLGEIDKVSLMGLPYLTGELQRFGVNVFFSYGEGQDYKDSTKQVAQMDQGGLGLPERDYYTRTGDKDKQLRQSYVEHITNMLSFLGETPQQALVDAKNILAFETKLAEASMTNVERRDPEKVYNPQTLAKFEASLGIPFTPFFQAVHSPRIDSLVNGNPAFFPAMVKAIRATDMQTLRAYMKYQLATTYAAQLPKRIDQENFKFYGTVLSGQPEQRARWKRCSSAVDGQMGEAVGQVFVSQYFPGDSKAKVLQMVHDLEEAMAADFKTLEWMSPATREKAKAKLDLVANKIGYPDHWRDYSALQIDPTDAFGNQQRASAFENDRVLNKIGKPVDKFEWITTPATVNAFYNPSMNDINFPAAILQPAFYDATSDDLAANYGHMGAVIGHELTHGFDDEGRKFDGFGNLKDWWTPEDKKKFETRTGCLVKEYGNFTAIDDLKVDGALTLGENTADNGGLVIAYSAYLARAKKEGIDIHKKIDGMTGPQRFYVAWAQNWCENSRPEMVRQLVHVDTHSPDHFRANGAAVNQPGFSSAFGCKKGSPMVPEDACRVW